LNCGPNTEEAADYRELADWMAVWSVPGEQVSAVFPEITGKKQVKLDNFR
jgi:hypothetical protein